MSQKNPDNIPIAWLAGVIGHSGEHKACSLVYQFETEGGEIIHQLTYGQLMEALHFAQSQAIIPPLSSDWWARTGRTDGCSF